MADLTRADELVRTIERDAAFQAEVEAAPTATAKRRVLDAHGFRDIGLGDMRAYVERKGGALVVLPARRELSEQELASVAGGLTDGEGIGIIVGAGVATVDTGGHAMAAAAAV